MTAQAPEILILEGKEIEVYLGSWPTLPKNDPRILRSAETTLRTDCWREYFGTWEIKKGGLFLVDLSGNYTLKAGEPIFAEWYSGEIVAPEGEPLGYGAMGAPYL